MQRNPKNQKRPGDSWRAAVLLPFAIGLILAAIPDLLRLDSWIRAVILLVAGLVIIGLVFSFDVTKRKRWKVAAVGFVLLVLSVGISLAFLPPPEKKLVAEYAEAICGDPGLWVPGTVTCYQSSQDFIVNNFQAFDPNSWHAFKELPEVEAISASRMVKQAPMLAGRGMLSLAKVIDVQPLGGTVVMQMKELSPAESRALQSAPQLNTMAVDEDQRIALSWTSLPEKSDGELRIFCNLPIRPFFSPKAGQIAIFNGVVLAIGQGQKMDDGKIGPGMRTLYITCSSAEVFDLQGPLSS